MNVRKLVAKGVLIYMIDTILAYWLKGIGLGLGLYTVILASELPGKLAWLVARSF